MKPKIKLKAVGILKELADLKAENAEIKISNSRLINALEAAMDDLKAAPLHADSRLQAYVDIENMSKEVAGNIKGRD